MKRKTKRVQLRSETIAVLSRVHGGEPGGGGTIDTDTNPASRFCPLPTAFGCPSPTLFLCPGPGNGTSLCPA
jgi:hypothetical protein